MKQNRKFLWLCLGLLMLTVLATGCGGEATPYELNNKENYTVSVRFDANGGTFTTNAPVITDSYNITDLPVGSDGKVQIPLLAPNDPKRDKDAFTPVKSGYFLVGWYAQCETAWETATYAKPWDFQVDRLSVDPNGSYSSETPVLTLYAAWAPLYQIEFYDLENGDLLSSLSFDPNDGREFTLPAWDTQTGMLEMYKFPEKVDCTLDGVYLDASATQPVTDLTLTHNGTVDSSDATVENGTMRLYLSYRQGNWFRIQTAEQFADNYLPSGCYELLADLDFSDATWPTAMMYGNFSGTILGNGHTISNVEIVQTDNSKASAGLFGQLAQTARLENVHFDNITFTVKKGARMTGTTYGLLCGTLSDGAALENVTVQNSILAIDSGCYFGTDDYVIGLICGMGQCPVASHGITCQAVGDNPENVQITVSEGQVTLEFVTE